VLFEEIAEGFVRKVLERDHTVFGQAVERMPGLTVKGDAFANLVGVACHQAALLLLRLREAPLRDDLGRGLFLLDDDDRNAAARLPPPWTL